MLVKQKLSQDRVKKISLNMDGDKPCCFGKIEINGLTMGEGIISVEFNLVATERPEIIVEYSPYGITTEVSDALGLEKKDREKGE
ncbi:hypothetical protein [Halalkalibacterium ligniniphilum]|uniref:hypothetical protein n=1 Tax=Halalkalibacterium ligniniphilum TaxID=1134413 RepID=UPI00037B552B|nr:hypothetical protein [Halalkalibacterium ligniniphilum]